MPQVNRAVEEFTVANVNSAPDATPDLENVEFMMALDAQNLVGSGFDNSVRRAAEAIGAEFLLNILAPETLSYQRAALVRLTDGHGQIVLVSLSPDGVTMEAHSEQPETAHLFRLGEAWLSVADQFRKLA